MKYNSVVTGTLESDMHLSAGPVIAGSSASSGGVIEVE
jgi:hypothetical protein